MQSVLVLVRDVTVQILGNAELSVKLTNQYFLRRRSKTMTYLVQGDSIVDQVQKAVVSNSSFGGGDELGSDFWVFGVDKSQVDRVKFGIVEVFCRLGRRNPFRHFRFALG